MASRTPIGWWWPPIGTRTRWWAIRAQACFFASQAAESPHSHGLPKLVEVLEQQGVEASGLASLPLRALTRMTVTSRYPLEAQANYNEASPVIHAMRSTITARGQTVVPAPIRERFGLGPSTRLEWIVDGDGAIRVVPVDLDPIRAFRGSGAGGGTARLLKERQLERRKEDE
jgi:AbrB family looped-hinge helix DNA binding protein